MCEDLFERFVSELPLGREIGGRKRQEWEGVEGRWEVETKGEEMSSNKTEVGNINLF